MGKMSVQTEERASFRITRMGYGGIVYAFITPGRERSHDISHREVGSVSSISRVFLWGFHIVCSLGWFMDRILRDIVHLAALAGLGVAIGWLGQGDTDRGAAARTALLALTLIESLAGNDAVDFCSTCEMESGQSSMESVPVRMFWKASSTLLASRAEVSMKERLFSPSERRKILADWRRTNKSYRRLTGKLLGLLGGHSAQMSQIGLVSNQHDDNVTVGMISQLLEPSGDVLVCLVLADVVNEQGTDGTAVVS